MKRMTWFVGLLLTACLLAAAAAPGALAAPAKWDGTVAEGFAGGTGTAEDPYQIENGASWPCWQSWSTRGTRTTTPPAMR